MLTSFSPIAALLLLVGAEVAVPPTATAEEAQAAPLNLEARRADRITCFVALTGDHPEATTKSQLYRGWYCMPEEQPAAAH